MIPRIKSLVPRKGAPSLVDARNGASPAAPRLRATNARPLAGHRLLVIGSSTGGPEALTRLVAKLPPLPVPVALAVVQHMPPLFTRQFAARLDRQYDFEVVEAEPGQALRPGMVAIAPGDRHLEVPSDARGLVAG